MHPMSRLYLINLIAGSLAILSFQANAIEDLRITIQSTNAILSWPSAAAETFIIQFRSDLQPGTPWITLSSAYPAAPGTNRTSFMHTGGVSYPDCGGSGGGGGGQPPSPLMVQGLEGSVIATTEPDAVNMLRREDEMTAKPERRYRADPPLPPMPQELAESLGVPWAAAAVYYPVGGLDGPTSDGPESGNCVTTGFYRVVRHGIHLAYVEDNDVLDGVYLMEAEFGADSGSLQSVTVTDNEAAFEGADMIIPTNGPLSFVLDTTRMTNGAHILQLQAYLLPTNAPPPVPDGTLLTLIEGRQIPVTVQNEISFPYWESFYFEDYEVLYVQARCAHPNISWRIDFFGEADDYIGGFNGQSTDGIILAAWNLRNPQGQLRTDAFFTPVVTATWAGGSAQEAAPRSWKGKDNFPPQGDWVVANQQAWENWNNAEYLDSVADEMVMGLEGAGFVVRPAHPFGEAFRLPVTHNGEPVSSTILTQAWNTLFTAITNFNSRNLFYLGHGQPRSIGGYPTPGAGRGITAAELSLGLRNLSFAYLMVNGPVYDPHRYRFVYLHGCTTADGLLPFSFGVTNNRDPELYLYQPGEARPTAFMGFKGTVPMGIRNGIYLHHPNYISHFFIEWSLNGWPLNVARQRAKDNYADTAGFPLSKLKIVGYQTLGVVEANNK